VSGCERAGSGAEKKWGHARDELTVAIDETACGLQELRETWDVGMRRTLAQLDQVRRLTEQVARRVAHYHCLLRPLDRR
jgi:hypothetical protein